MLILQIVASLAIALLVVREAMQIVEFGGHDPRFGAIGAGAIVGLAVTALAVWL